ncbi:MAG: hypothetical protein RIQ52_1474, partial [Pseudomonadota bacterium]
MTQIVTKESFWVDLTPMGADRLQNYSALATRIINSPQSSDEAPVFIVGDMHGNATKLISTLVITGAVQITKADYELWCSIYAALPPNVFDQRDWSWVQSQPDMDRRKRANMLFENCMRPENLIKDLQLIFKTLRWNKAFNGQIVLLGDQLHDRGSSDLMTLLLMQEMHRHGINFTYILGNHDQGALVAYLHGNPDIAGNNILSVPAGLQGKDLLVAKPTDRCSWDYQLLPRGQKKIFREALKTVMTHLRLAEVITVGREYVVCTHAPLRPGLVCRVVNQLAALHGQSVEQTPAAMSPVLIEQMNTLFIRALNGKAALRQSLAQASSSGSLAQFIKLRKAESTDETFAGQATCQTYPGYINIYGHDDAGTAGMTRLMGPVSSKDPSPMTHSSHLVCLDTRVGRPSMDVQKFQIDASQILSSYATPNSIDTDIRKLYVENEKSDAGGLLLVTVRPKYKNPAMKLEQLRAIATDACHSYAAWIQYLIKTKTSLSGFDESRTAKSFEAAMLAPTVDTPQKARQVIARFARGDFHQSDIRASLPTGQHALISHLLDSINAHCPPLTLAMKIGISEMNSSHQRFTVEYETEAELTAKVDGWRQLDGT